MEKVLHFEQIRELLPYSSPFLLVDKITDWISNEKIIGKKVISGSDPLIYSHFKSGMVLVLLKHLHLHIYDFYKHLPGSFQVLP